MIEVGDTVKIMQGKDIVCWRAKILYKPLSKNDYWRFLNLSSGGTEIETNERITIIKANIEK